MVRLATIDDLDDLITMMKHYAESSPIVELRTNQNEPHVRALLTLIIQNDGGRVWIAHKDNKAIGMLIALFNPNIWNPNLYCMAELAWWVEPEHRHTSAGYRLVTEYKNFANDEMKAGRIYFWTLSKMVSSPDLDYTKLGVTRIEETHTCQQPF